MAACAPMANWDTVASAQLDSPGRIAIPVRNAIRRRVRTVGRAGLTSKDSYALARRASAVPVASWTLTTNANRIPAKTTESVGYVFVLFFSVLQFLNHFV